MNTDKYVLFEPALEEAIQQTKALGDAFGKDIVLVRDLRGRIRVILPGQREDYVDAKQARLTQFGTAITESLGAYGFPVDRAILFVDDLAQADEVGVASDRRVVFEGSGVRIYLLDRQIIGQDWMRGPLERKTRNARVTFFGIKGGVGRSTALVCWAWRLAKQGKRILAFDLDLESPGVSSTLLPQEVLPDFGIVDWFVEDGVGQAGIVEESMIGSSPLARDLPGDVRVVPAYGRKTGDYMPKLARCYSEFSGGQSISWAERVQGMVERLEDSEKPDVVILDSRAGLHDIAAVLVTRMNADALLFAVDSPQTWLAYSFLFKHWRNHPNVSDFRGRLQVVAGMVPETGREAYLKSFCERSWDVFRDCLYDEVRGNDTDAFSFDLNDEAAPHYAVPIFWNRAMQEFNPAASASGVDAKTAQESLGLFMDEADRLVATDGEEEKP